MNNFEELSEKIAALEQRVHSLLISDERLDEELGELKKLVREDSGGVPEVAAVAADKAALLAAIVESSDDAIVSKTLDGIVTSWNKGAERMFGYTAEEVVGRSITLIFPPGSYDEEEMILSRLRRGERLEQYETTRVRKTGEEIMISLTSSPLVDSVGNVVGISSIGRDITEERKAKRRLGELEARFSRELSRLIRLHQVSLWSGAERDLSALLKEILESVLASTDAFKGNIQLYDAETGRLSIGAYSGFGPKFLQFFEKVAVGEACVCGQAWKAQERFIVEDVTESPLFADTEAGRVLTCEGVGAIQSTPLKTRAGEFLGMLSTHYPRPTCISEAELRTLDLFARQAADFIQNFVSARQLSESRTRFQAMFDSITDAVIFTNPERQIEVVNPGFTQIFGYDADEVLGRKTDFLYENREAFQSQEKRFSSEGENLPRSLYEIQYRRKSGELFWCESLGVRVSDAEKRHLGNLGIHRDISARKTAERQLLEWSQELEHRVAERTEELEKSRDHLRGLAIQLTRVEAEERKKIAEVLHGNLQQLLVAAKTRLELAGETEDTEKVYRHLDRTCSILEEAITATRSLSVEISPPVLGRRDLVEGLEWLANRFNDQGSFGVNLLIESEPQPILPEILNLLYSFVRELLLNAMKHSGESSAEVLVKPSGERLEIRVRDRGRGFDPEDQRSAEDDSGFGLFSIRERLAHVGGEVHINSEQGQGTEVLISLPGEHCFADA